MPASCSVSDDAMAEESPANLTVDLTDVNHDDILNGDDTANDDCEAPENPIDLQIRNVVSMFHSCAHIDLRKITAEMCHAVYDRSKGVS